MSSTLIKRQTEYAHPDFGVIVVRGYKDREVCIKQINDRLYLTPNQVVELRDILDELIAQEKVCE